jgi:hypothetical protein
MEARAEEGRAEVGPGGQAPPPALPVRVLQVFYAPGQLFERLRLRPLWGAALLLGAVFVAASVILIPTDVWEEMFRQQMLRSGRQMPEGFNLGVLKWFGLVGGVLFWFVLTLFLAGVSALIFHLMLGDEGRFVQYLSVVAHALLIPAIGGLLLVPLKIAQRDPQMTLNLSLFIPMDSDAYPLRVLRGLDLFQIWSCLVMAVGIAKIDVRRSWGSAAVFLLVVALVMAMLFAAFNPGA